MHVLLAFDKFKDSLTAPAACETAAAVLRQSGVACTLDPCPLADGGEGFAPILTSGVGGRMEKVVVAGPRCTQVEAGFGLARIDRLSAAARARLALPPTLAPDAIIAIIEMAAASGLALVPSAQRDPWLSTSRGTGELIRHAVERKADAILLGIGGSATNDLGFGALSALGLSFYTAGGLALEPKPAYWSDLALIGGKIDPLPPIRIACDVSNPLLGPNGAAAVYGPQKGLKPQDLARLESESARVSGLLSEHCRRPNRLAHLPGAGAAGGIAFGLMTATGAQLLPGFELISDWLDLDARLARADVVITGEGRFDETSLQGKGPGAVAQRALQLGKPVHVFAGQIRPPAERPRGLHLHAITPEGMPLAQALAEAPALLAASVRRAVAAGM